MEAESLEKNPQKPFSTGSWPTPRNLWPQLLARDRGTFAERCQLRPDDRVGHHRLGAHGGAETAIDAGDQSLAIDHLGVAADALRNEARVLDEIRRRVDDTRNEDFVVGDLDRLEVFPFVVVARIGGLDAERLHLGLERDVDDFCHRQIVGVRPLVVAPADVQPHAVGGQPFDRGVEGCDIALGDF
jgi:hypothetical protein